MALQPLEMTDETTYEGHLDAEPLPQILFTLLTTHATGRVSVRDAYGPNYLFFMQGRPVGVVLSQVTHPLGQLLLELGMVDSAQFVKAQRLIGEGERLPGQVFIEIGAITEAELKETLAIQARRKAERFVAFTGLPFEFNKGLSFLTGFKSSPLDGPPLVFHAVAASMSPEAREAFLQQRFGNQQIRAPQIQLGAAPEAFGFGRAEERFFLKLQDWNTVAELDQGGTLPRPEMAAILRFLDGIRQLEVAPPGVVHKPPPVAVPMPVFDDPTPAPAPPPKRPPPPAAASYGPAPNSARVATRPRDLGAGRADPAKALPSVVIDLDAAVTPPPKR